MESPYTPAPLEDEDSPSTPEPPPAAEDTPCRPSNVVLWTRNPAPLPVQADEAQLRQVVLNLAALAFMIPLGIPCPWDCGDSGGDVGIVDLLALLKQWGGAGSCDFDGGGVGIADLLELLASWGPCGP